jgi:hypothetical protein
MCQMPARVSTNRDFWQMRDRCGHASAKIAENAASGSVSAPWR